MQKCQQISCRNINGKLLLDFLSVFFQDVAAQFDNQLFQTVLRNIITIAFIVPLIELLKKVKIQKRFLIWLGTISYEIYSIHPFILYFFEKETAEGKQVGNLEIVLWTIGLTLLLSSVLKVVQDNLVRKVRS